MLKMVLQNMVRQKGSWWLVVGGWWLVFLVVGVLGGWCFWWLVFLVVGVLGGWCSWWLVFLVVDVLGVLGVLGAHLVRLLFVHVRLFSNPFVLLLCSICVLAFINVLQDLMPVKKC